MSVAYVPCSSYASRMETAFAIKRHFPIGNGIYFRVVSDSSTAGQHSLRDYSVSFWHNGVFVRLFNKHKMLKRICQLVLYNNTEVENIDYRVSYCFCASENF